jgi:3-dehydroquinate dehydratase/shikimate dehydrogenase
MICIPIVASNVNEALKDMKKACRIADLVELRLDFIKNINERNLKKLLSNKKAIVTDRKKRLNLIRKAIELKVDFVDMDISIGEKTIRKIISEKKKTKVIVSFHNFKRTNKKEIIEKYKKIKKIKPDVIKIVTLANSINDNKVIFDLIKKSDQKIIALCMGEKGEISRILSPLFGGFLTFGSLEKGKESAPGQITVDMLRNVYRINRLNKPGVFGLVGNPVKHSKGIIIHNKRFRKLRLNKIYVNFLVDDLKRFVKEYKAVVNGLSITIPFKREIIKHLDRVDPIARKIGAVNTVIKKNGKLIGYNTDLIGAIKAIERRIKIKNKKILMIGAGGVARAIGYGIVQKKGKLVVLNRTMKKAKKLARELKCKGGGLNRLKEQRNIDIIINATLIGMFPDVNKTPIKKKILKKIVNKRAVVFDSVYNPKKTKLLKESKRLGCNIIGGYDMFINQAEEQSKLFAK